MGNINCIAQLLMLTAFTRCCPESRRNTELDKDSKRRDMGETGRLRQLLELFRFSPRKLQHFSSRELQEHMALEVPLEVSYKELDKSLQNSIHPLLMRGHWSDEVRYSNNVWNCLDPVLRLASRFISEDALMPFFYNLIFKRETLPADYYYPLESFTVGSSITSEQLQLTQSWLQDLGSGTNQISFEFFIETRTHMKRSGYSETDLPENTSGIEENEVSKVCLNQDYLEILHDHFSGIRCLTPCQLLRVRLQMAIIIVHELAHSVYTLISPSPYEPYFMDQQTSELGRAWECWVFGGIVCSLGGYYDSRAGLLLADWPGIHMGVVPRGWDKEVAASERQLGLANSLPANPWGDQAAPWRGPLVDSMVKWVVPMGYVLKIQREDFWTREFASRGVEALRMPKTYGKRTYRSRRADQADGETVRGAT